MNLVPLTRKPMKPLESFVEKLRVDTTGCDKIGRMNVTPYRSNQSTRTTVDDWEFDLPDSIRKQIDVNSGYIIALSSDLYVYVHREKKSAFAISLVDYTHRPGPIVIQDFSDCSAWQIHRCESLSDACFNWQIDYWTQHSLQSGFQRHSIKLKALGEIFGGTAA